MLPIALYSSIILVCRTFWTRNVRVERAPSKEGSAKPMAAVTGREQASEARPESGPVEPKAAWPWPNRRLPGTPLWLSPDLRRSGSLFEHLLDRLQAGLIRAADQFHRAGVTLPFGNVVPRILALERPDPGHRRPTGAVALDGQARLVMIDGQRRFDDVVGVRHALLIQSDQLFGKGGAVLERQRSDRAHLIVSAFDQWAAREGRVPVDQAVESLHQVPDVRWRGFDLDHLGDDQQRPVIGEGDT